MAHVIASISWNSNHWIAEPTRDDIKFMSFGKVANKVLPVPNESWNFNRTKHVLKGYKYGAFQNANHVRNFRNGEDIVFFWSRSPRGGVFVGLYAQPELLSTYGPIAGLPSSTELNVRVSINPSYRICQFDDYVPSIPRRHFQYRDRIKKKLGQICFSYIDDVSARNILEDALERNSTNKDLVQVKRRYGF